MTTLSIYISRPRKEALSQKISYLFFDIWRSLAENFAKLIFHNPVKGEVICAIATLTWGTWLLNPATNFNGSGYLILSSIGTEAQWAFAFTFIGWTQLLSTLSGKALLRRPLAIIMVALWTFLGVIFVTNPQSLSTELGILCLIQAASSAWTFFQIGWNGTE